MTVFDRRPRELAESLRAAAVRPVGRAEVPHLLLLLACCALAGYAVWHWLDSPALATLLAWFVGAALAHDLVVFPLGALLDRAVRALPRTRVPLVNHVRVPLLGAGLTFLVFLPGIVRDGAESFHAASGLDQSPYLLRWLLLVAAMVVASALVYVVRAVRRR